MKFSKLYIVLVLLFALVIPAQAQEASTTTVFGMADGATIDNAWSTLQRSDNGVVMTLHTQDLEPNSVYTIWWVIFNDAASCSDGACGLDDLFYIEADGSIQKDEFGQRVLNFDALETAQVSIQFATGGLVGEGGAGHFAAALAAGDAVPGIIVGPGLIDPATAEVHLVVRTHGALVPELFDAQISDFGGGCEPADAPPCDDVQAAVHMPAVQ